MYGRADIAYWTNRLAPERLVPAERNGRTQIVIIAANMAFRGIRFTEISISIEVVLDESGIWPNAVFLMHAFTTNRLFAFCERMFFRTPYYHGDCLVSVSSPVSIQLGKPEKPMFHAEMRPAASPSDRSPTQSRLDRWEGPIYIPTKQPSKKSLAFFGRLQGLTNKYPFRPDIDSLSIVPTPGVEILQALIDSNFSAEEWLVREDAAHARSKTYTRLSLFGP